MTEYKTKQGDTWDKIAFDFYGEENRMDALMRENTDKLCYFVFSSGIKLNIPDLDTEQKQDSPPPWLEVVG